MKQNINITIEQCTKLFLRHGISYNVAHIYRIPTGFNNECYDVGDYILKVCSHEANRPNMAREAYFYKQFAHVTEVPELVAYDMSKDLIDSDYLICKKVAGRPLASFWHTLDNQVRRDLIEQLCVKLKAINAVDTKSLTGTPLDYEQDCFVETGTYWKDLISYRLHEVLARVGPKGKAILSAKVVSQLEKYIHDNCHVLEQQNLKLIYWDIHFDNMFVGPNNKLNALLDFEDVEIGSLDYPLRIVREMSKLPQLYLHSSMAELAKPNDYRYLLAWYKKFYPEAFKFNQLSKRLDMYDLYDNLQIIPRYPNSKSLRSRLLSVLK